VLRWERGGSSFLPRRRIRAFGGIGRKPQPVSEGAPFFPGKLPREKEIPVLCETSTQEKKGKERQNHQIKSPIRWGGLFGKRKKRKTLVLVIGEKRELGKAPPRVY